MEAVVLYEYIKEQEDELTLGVGDTLTDVKKVDEGWCEGTLHGQRGVFPDNFVQILPRGGGGAKEEKAAEPAPPPSTGGGAGVVLRDTKNKSRRAKVAFSYAAENVDEINLQPGQTVEVIEEEEEGWWRGKVGDKVGLFPSNFVEIVEETDTKDRADTSAAPPPTTAPVDRRGPAPPPSTAAAEAPSRHSNLFGQKLFPSLNPQEARAKLKKSQPPPPAVPRSEGPKHPPMSEDPKRPPPPAQSKLPPPVPAQVTPSRPAAPEKPPMEKARVTFDYDAQESDEITIKEGDILEVVQKDIQEGWWEVRLGDQTGMVPDNFLDPIKPSAAAPTQSTAPKKPVPMQPSPPAEVKPDPVLPPREKAPSVSRPPPPHSTKKDVKRPPPPPAAAEPTPEDKGFPVAPTEHLDNSAALSKPRKMEGTRPPSRVNLHQGLQDESHTESPPAPAPAPAPTATTPPASTGLSPWQAELQKRKSKPPPKTARKPPQPTPPPSFASATPLKPPAAQATATPLKPPAAQATATPPKPPSTPAAATPPKPPAAQPAALPHKPIGAASKPSPPPPPSSSEPEAKPKPAPTSSKPPLPRHPSITTPSPPPSNEHTPAPKPAAEPVERKETKDVVIDSAVKADLAKLRKEYEEFKGNILNEIRILTDDLDTERKRRAELEIVVDRLKKTREFRDKY